MTRAEEGLLLLCCPLGDADARPLTVAQYRRLSEKVTAQAMTGDPLRELDTADLLRIGCSDEEAARILALLAREDTLHRYLAAAQRRGIFVCTRLSPDFPTQLHAKLGIDAPAALFCAGDRSLLQTRCVALVGSRALREKGEQFARRVGTLAAQEGVTLTSGGAVGADSCAQESCLAAGGRVLCFAADSLSDRLHEPLPPGLLLVSELGWELPFSTPRAFSRNRLIHAMADRAFVAQTDNGTGGTWQGAQENLRHGWSPVFVCDDGSSGARALCERGATAVAPEQLCSLASCSPNQMSFF
jgi:predicted Rossmann fold nucleotide-binding protein DprA/Smf involved in DNA uptake